VTKPKAAALFEAVKNGDVERAKNLVESTPGLLGAFDPDTYGAPALNIAVSRGDAAMMDVLLDGGANPDLKSEWWAGGFAALHILPPSRRMELADRLIAGGATVDAHAAAWLGDLPALVECVEADPDVVHERGGDGRMPLHFATTPAVARFLLESGADIEAKDVDHESTPVMWAAADYPDVARTLLDAGANGDVFLYAAIGDTDALATTVVSTPDAATSVINSERFPTSHKKVTVIYAFTLGWLATPLHVAARCNQPEAIRTLLALGADVAVRGAYDDATPLHIAAWEGSVEAAQALLHAGAPLDAVSGPQHKNEPVGWAITSGKVDVVKLLVGHGAALGDHHRSGARAGVEGEFTQWSGSTLDDWREIQDLIEGQFSGA